MQTRVPNQIDMSDTLQSKLLSQTGESPFPKIDIVSVIFKLSAADKIVRRVWTIIDVLYNQNLHISIMIDDRKMKVSLHRAGKVASNPSDGSSAAQLSNIPHNSSIGYD